MKLPLIILACAVAGYVIGNVFPFIDFVTPKKTLTFEADYLIKAGQTATSRFYGTSLEPIELPIELSLPRANLPKLKESNP